MTKQYSIADARDNFTQVVHEAEDGVKVELTRRGKPVAVLLSVDDYDRLSRSKTSFFEAYEKFLSEFDLKELDIDPDSVFQQSRDSSPGRSFDW